MSARDDHCTCPVTIDDLNVRCTIPWFIDGTEYAPLDCTFKMLNCGEDAFKEVHRAISAARHSVNYICWGFQPSMHFIRNGVLPPIGRLMEEVALRGVKVKVLCWATQPLGIDVVSTATGEPNTPGRRLISTDRPKTHEDEQYEFDRWWYGQFEAVRPTQDRIKDWFIDEPYYPGRPWLKQYKTKQEREQREKELEIIRQNLQFRSRDFSHNDRTALYGMAFEDPNVPLQQRAFMSAFPSHHQKVVVIDVESPLEHVAFVMGHNTLDEYWDTPRHSFFKKSYHLGRNGKNPRQDISSRVTGPVVGNLFYNFKQAWERPTDPPIPTASTAGAGLAGMAGVLAARKATEAAEAAARKEDAVRHPLPDLPPTYFENFPLYTSKLIVTEGKDPSPENLEKIRCSLTEITTSYSGGAHILRTHTHEPYRFDIRDSYKHVVKMATQCIYIENQFFRWPPMAEWLKEAAQVQTGAGRNPVGDGSLYVFVVTNSSNEGIGPGTQKTYEMLDSLGRADALPGVARENRIDDLGTQIDQTNEEIRKLSWENDRLNHRSAPLRQRNQPRIEANEKRIAELKQHKETLQKQRTDLKGDKKAETIAPESRPGLKIHVCTLTSPDTPDDLNWNEVYIHTKLMIIDDTYMTLGSANINTRSMEIDTELNIAHSRSTISTEARKTLWGQHTGGRSAHGLDEMKEAFDEWSEIIDQNRDNEKTPISPICSLRGFLRTDPKISKLD